MSKYSGINLPGSLLRLVTTNVSITINKQIHYPYDTAHILEWVYIGDFVVKFNMLNFEKMDYWFLWNQMVF